jgi:hypothetical protein
MWCGTLLCWLVVSVTPVAGTAEDGPESPTRAAPLSDSEKEHFLLEGRIVRNRSAPGGTTLSRRVTLSLDGFEHDAQIQTIDVAKQVFQLRSGPEFDFRDSYKNNIAAYRLDRLLGLGMVPVTVLRHYETKPAAYTWWVDDVLMDVEEQSTKKVPPPDPERWNCQIYAMRTFDQLIYNTDRNAGNLLIDKDWWVWMIDHTRAFKVFKDLENKKGLGSGCGRRFLAALKRLDAPTLESSMEDVLTSGQIKGLLGRRDKIVAYYEERIKKQGKEEVLCDLPSPGEAAEPPGGDPAH